MKPDKTICEEPETSYRSVWLKVEFEQLKKDDIFRMFESDDEPVIGADGSKTFRALDHPNKLEGINSIKISEEKETAEKEENIHGYDN